MAIGGKSIVFITNIKDMDAIGITEIYKSRWDIEILDLFGK
jgi:IS4 transposase